MKLRANLSSLPGPARLTARVLLTAGAAITAFWILGAFVDALHLSIRQGETLRESQRSGSAIGAVAQR